MIPRLVPPLAGYPHNKEKVTACLILTSVRFGLFCYSMSIPLQQLATWSHQGGTGISTEAYRSIDAALTKSSSPLSGRRVRIFLQGSCANATNTHGDSGDEQSVSYQYTNEPVVSARSTMHTHRGTATLVLKNGGLILEGEYYSGRDRQNIGTIRLEKETAEE
jgi:predicted pore-forming effector associated with SMODS systems